MTTKDFQTKRPLAIFLSYFRPHRRLFALDITCAFMISLVDLAFPLISRTAMYQWLPQQQYRTFFIVMGIVVLAFVLRSFLCFVVGYWGHTFGIRVEADIRRDLFRHMQELGFDFYDRNRTGQLMSRLTSDLFEVTELAHHGPEDLFISAVTIVGALIVMFSIQWRLALVVSLIIPIFMVVVMYRRRQMSAASRAAKQKTGVINAEIESGLSGVRTTKAFANEEKQQTRFDGANEIFKTAKRGFHKEMGLFNASMEFFICILSVVVIAVGGWLIMKGQMDYVGLITFSLYITTFISPIRKLANFAEMFSNGFAGLHRFIELMATEPTIQDAPDAVELSQVRGEVALDHVSFTYPGSSEVLHDIDLTVAAGETVAIVGPSGGGKSTLCQLVPRFYDVTEGSIRVDGLDVRQVTQRSLRRAIGIVQQDVFLFADTIRENIRYGRPDATDEEVEQAAHRAELLEDIRTMPQGFDTYVGERGAMLSGGQKQRVAIARALATDPKVLLCDEATSALDPTTTNSILALLKELNQKLGVTVVIITHQMSVIEEICTRVAILDGGEVAEEGRVEDIFAHPATDAARRLVYPGGVSAKQYPAGTRAVRVSFNGGTVYDPLIASLAIDCSVKVTILGADTRTIDGKAFGTMLLLLPDDPNEAAKALSYIRSQPNITAEEVEYHA